MRIEKLIGYISYLEHTFKKINLLSLQVNYFPNIHPWVIENNIIDPALISQDWLSIKHTMWNYVGLIRTRQRLHRAQTILRNLQNDIEGFYQKTKLMIKLRGLKRMILDHYQFFYLLALLLDLAQRMLKIN